MKENFYHYISLLLIILGFLFCKTNLEPIIIASLFLSSGMFAIAQRMQK